MELAPPPTRNSFGPANHPRKPPYKKGPPKPQRRPDPRCESQPPSNPPVRQNSCDRPRPAHNNAARQYRGRNCPPPISPPPLQRNTIQPGPAHQGSCCPTPRPCSDGIDSNISSATQCPTSSGLLTLQLKREIYQALKIQPHASCPQEPALMPQKNTTPPIITRSNPNKMERDEMLLSTPTHHTISQEQPPRIPEVTSCPPKSTYLPNGPSTQPGESLPPPPGLSKPKSRGLRCDLGARTSTTSVSGERRLSQVVEDSCAKRNDTNRVLPNQAIPPPPGLTRPRVKLPTNQTKPVPVPRSPTVSSSSLSEDLSGSSSAMWTRSDTTFTSVESNVSRKVPPRRKPFDEVCRNWLNGHPCRFVPCRFLHKRPDQIAEQPEPLYVTTISDHIKVRLDRGFDVREVVTGFESRWVHLGNVASGVTSAALSELLSPYQVDTLNVPESAAGKPVTVKVQFTSAADAIKAVTSLNGIELAKKPITAKLAINNSIRGGTVLKNTDAQLVWESPFRVGYAGYDTLKEARAALDSLNGVMLEYLVVSAQLYEGLPCVGAYNVIFKQLPASTTEQDLRKFAKSKAVMLGRENYKSLDKAVKAIRTRVEEYGTVTGFEVLPPPYKDGMVKAWVQFTTPAEARAAQDDLDHRRPKQIGHTTITCRHVVSVSHVLSAASYRKMREDIGWLRWSWQRRYGPSVAIREKVKENSEDDAPVYIRLASERPELLSNLKYEFEQLLQGETIMFERRPLWDDFLITEAGRAYIAQMQFQYPGIQIQVRKDRRTISLWGPIVVRHRARQDIVRKIMELKAQQFWKIPLSGKLLGIFCSVELSTLQGLLGPENCILECGERALVIRGNDSAYQTACKAVQDAQNRQGDEPSSSEATCPVCFGEVIMPVALACGHQWCRSCLTSYLTSAVENRMFPLKCLGNNASCTERIPLGLSRRLLSAADFNAVLEAAFWTYVHSRPEEFHNCPTPDCNQVYRSAPPNSVLQCPSCLVRICPACRIEYHDGMTCEERDVAEDKLFQEWTSNNDVKSCPGCKVPIERSEGCNHMTCTRCQTHICWECMATFPRGEGIYEHMHAQHGGIGL